MRVRVGAVFMCILDLLLSVRLRLGPGLAGAALVHRDAREGVVDVFTAAAPAYNVTYIMIYMYVYTESARQKHGNALIRVSILLIVALP